MKDDLEQLLKSLHLRKIAELFDEEAKRAEKADLSYQEFVARLLRAQWQANQEAALAWRIKRAGIPEQWTLETFPFKRQPGVNARQIRTFAELEFVPKAENIVFVGPTGVGQCLEQDRGREAGLAERPSRRVHARSGSVRRDVRVDRRPIDAAATQPARQG